MVHPSWSDYPHLLADLDMTKNKNHIHRGNPINVLELTPGTNKTLDWKCSTCEHEWKSTGANRVAGNGCPACVGRLHSDGRNSMYNTHPDLAKEYQGDANLIIAGTDKKLDWKCITCEHMWGAVGSSRVNGCGCPACFGHLHSDGRNSMFNTYPQLAEEYQGDATLIVAGTNKKLDWKCITCEHKWTSMGNSRVSKGSGCPACVNKVIHKDGRNSMAMTHLDLAKEYQGDATKLIAGTHKKLDWKCITCEHVWSALGSSRVNGNGCPACAGKRLHSGGRNSMAMTHPQLAKEYQGDANFILAGTHKKLPWKCSTCNHKWNAAGRHRARETGCPACVNQVIHTDGRNNMAMTHPDLAVEYQGDANLIIAGTNKKLDWKCSTCEHMWSAVGSSRVNGRGCPACVNQVIHTDGRNSMAMTHPDLAKEYQGDATLVVAGVARKLHWKCITCEHEWKSNGDNRVRGGNGCPACSGRSVHSDGRNSMSNTHPELAKEYLGDANLIIAGTNKKLDWKCLTCKSEWKTTGGNRVAGKGCSACANSGYDPSQIGYVYIHQYIDETNHWLKCGITGKPTDRFKQLSRAASRVNIEVEQLDIYTFDDGWIAQQCEQELLNSLELRFNSEYDIEGNSEFFKYSALEEIKNIIGKYL
jgi:DNA-directed RNA polymerase subunit RPC12/RpoP